jgi:hypothetical protein
MKWLETTPLPLSIFASFVSKTIPLHSDPTFLCVPLCLSTLSFFFLSFALAMDFLCLLVGYLHWGVLICSAVSLLTYAGLLGRVSSCSLTSITVPQLVQAYLFKEQDLKVRCDPFTFRSHDSVRRKSTQPSGRWSPEVSRH